MIDPTKESSNYLLHFHDFSTGARCQDGSHSGIYYQKGWGEGAKKVVVHIEGGAWCAGRDLESLLDDCLTRTQ